MGGLSGEEVRHLKYLAAHAGSQCGRGQGRRYAVKRTGASLLLKAGLSRGKVSLGGPRCCYKRPPAGPFAVLISAREEKGRVVVTLVIYHMHIREADSKIQQGRRSERVSASAG